MDDTKRARSATTDGQHPRPGLENAAGPAPIGASGQHQAYWILSTEERAKGFVRPVRTRYVHVGVRPQFPTRQLNAEEHDLHDGYGEKYVAFEEYPESELPRTGRYWTESKLKSGCGVVTAMSETIAETYARDPKFYGSTFCMGCRTHIPVEEFVWDEGKLTERIGS